MKRKAILAIGLAGLSIGLLPLAGCQALSPSTQPSEAEQKQANALAHPGTYDPRVDHDVSTGSPMKDFNDFLNP